MGYLKIYGVGFIWLLTVILSIKGWYKLFVLMLAFVLPAFKRKTEQYIENMLVSDDQDIYTLIGGKNPDITISDRVGRECIKLEDQGIYKSEWHQAEFIINRLFFLQKDDNGNYCHCRISIEHDELGV